MNDFWDGVLDGVFLVARLILALLFLIWVAQPAFSEPSGDLKIDEYLEQVKEPTEYERGYNDGVAAMNWDMVEINSRLMQACKLYGELGDEKK
jgi:hypothetical protein